MDEFNKLNHRTDHPSDPKEKQALIQALSKDAHIHRLMKTQAIPQEELARHPYLFQRYLDAVKPCVGCKSLADCGQKKQGYHMGIAYDGILLETIAACRYERQRLMDEAQMERYLVCDFGGVLRSVRFQKIALEGEASEYINTVVTLHDLAAKHQGVYLYGNMGTGKTYLAACAANQMADEGASAAFIHYPSFCDRIASSSYSGEYRKEAEYCEAAGILVIDDIGAEEVSERNRMVLLSILDSRMQRGRMTWFTSNCDLKSLQEHLRTVRGNESVSAADRIIERIKALAKPVYLDGNDRRSLYSYE